MLVDIDFGPIVLKERDEQIQSAFRAGTDNLIVTKLLSLAVFSTQFNFT